MPWTVAFSVFTPKTSNNSKSKSVAFQGYCVCARNQEHGVSMASGRPKGRPLQQIHPNIYTSNKPQKEQQ
ncbi:unnamed protein product [Cuscuta campestris]|uniref:Uncharacterized protein n=1 Tax=Cuscuta campestris TaxID=132261 RepID=A0A484L9T5_9ASTE|nr:unnamed protein product [Cuscuta campestris]